MSVKRINAIPTAGIPNFALPAYSLPMGDIVFTSASLAILRGGVTLGNPEYIDNRKLIPPGKPIAWRFIVKNPTGNPDATITSFTVTGDLEFFVAYDTSPDPTGITMASGATFSICMFSSYGISGLVDGINDFSGNFVIGNTFAGSTTNIETSHVFISYKIYQEPTFDGSGKGTKTPDLHGGKIAPYPYITEYEYNSKREPNSDISLNPKD